MGAAIRVMVSASGVGVKMAAATKMATMAYERVRAIVS